MSDEKNLHWQCRRGMRELDILLERYLRRDYAHSNDTEKATFRGLLTLSDPQLAAYLLRGEPHEDTVASDIIARILRRATA